jgi:lipopolysaccharide assembly outer membrane protein LptD (OstA)
MNMRKNVLRIGGGIKGRIEQGGFETKEVEVNTKTSKIKVPGEIVFYREDLWIKAQEMTGDLDTEVLTFSGEILLIEGDYTARGQSLKYYGKEERYVLEGGIEVELAL